MGLVVLSERDGALGIPDEFGVPSEYTAGPRGALTGARDDDRCSVLGSHRRYLCPSLSHLLRQKPYQGSTVVA